MKTHRATTHLPRRRPRPAEATAETSAPAVAPLRDPAAPAALRPAAIARAQGALGNAAVGRALGDRHASAHVIRRQGSAPAPAVATPAPAPAVASTGPGVTIDGDTLTTKGDVAGWYSLRALRLLGQQTELRNNDAYVPTSLQEAIDTARERGDGLAADGAAAVDTPSALGAQWWFDYMYTRALNAAESEKASLAAARVRLAEQKSREAQQHLEEQVLPTLRDAQRAAFRSDEESQLLTISDEIATVIDTSLILKDVLLDARVCAAELENMANVARGYRGVFPSANSMAPQIVELVEQANKAYAGFQLIRVGLDLVSSKKTGVGEGAAAVNAMSTLVSAGGTLLGASAYFTVYSNLYLGPMVSRCLTLLGRLSEQISRGDNRNAIEVGMPDQVAWENEPGGRPMFDFMLAVMRAGGPEGVPAVPEDVAKYFINNDEDFSAGAQGSEIPTKGFLFFKKLDQPRMAAWVFSNRANVWGMLYGAAKPPI